MLIGREKERSILLQLQQSKKSEFAILYGRRRVGKTFLVRETFKNNFDFSHVGLANSNTKEQLTNFHISLKKYGKKEDHIPKNWLFAFQELIALLSKSRKQKKVIFIDELPWLDTARSSFLNALEHFWNSWASGRKDILLIACGSAASWMIKKLVNNKGGLHNRVNQKIKLEPFTLRECKAYYQKKGFAFNEYQMLQLYMVLGGIPFYLDGLKKELSATQNIDELCFTKDGLLQNEFHNLYASLFKNHQQHLLAIEALSKKNKGLSREVLIQDSGLPNGGGTTTILEELELSGFIRLYLPFSKKKKEALYQLIDPFSLFYYRFIAKNTRISKGFWEKSIDNPSYRSWSGIAFEQVCLSHTDQIKIALGISGMQTSVSSWLSNQASKNAQIDLVIDRRDEVVNLFEMKFSISPFSISKKYANDLRNKVRVFKAETKTKKAIFISFLTTYGVLDNQHAKGLVQNNLEMGCLFL